VGFFDLPPLIATAKCWNPFILKKRPKAEGSELTTNCSQLKLNVRSGWEYALRKDPVIDYCGNTDQADFLASLYYDYYKLATQILSCLPSCN